MKNSLFNQWKLKAEFQNKRKGIHKNIIGKVQKEMDAINFGI